MYVVLCTNVHSSPVNSVHLISIYILTIYAIRHKSIFSNPKPDISWLINYKYYFYELLMTYYSYNTNQ